MCLNTSSDVTSVSGIEGMCCKWFYYRCYWSVGGLIGEALAIERASLGKANGYDCEDWDDVLRRRGGNVDYMEMLSQWHFTTHPWHVLWKVVRTKHKCMILTLVCIILTPCSHCHPHLLPHWLAWMAEAMHGHDDHGESFVFVEPLLIVLLLPHVHAQWVM